MIVPSIIAKNQKQLNKRFSKVKSLSKSFHLDVMDGRFVKNKSLNFNFKLPKNKKYTAHLMIRNPEAWIKKNKNKVDEIIVQAETIKDFNKIKNLVKNKKLGIALNPETKVSKIIDYLDKIYSILILTVHPGRYGSKFLPANLNKIKEIRKLNKNINIKVDGSINDKTIKQIKKFKPDELIVGSYLMNSDNPKKALKELK